MSTSAKSNEGSHNSLPVLERNISMNAGQTGLPRVQVSPLSKMNARTPGELNNYPQPQQQSARNQTGQCKQAKRNKGQCRNRNEWNKDAPQLENLPQK